MGNQYVAGWLKRTSVVCYVLSAWLIISIIAVYAIASQTASEVVYSGLTLQQAFRPFIPLIIGISFVSTALSVLFGVGAFRIGRNYGSAALPFVGVVYLFSAIITLVLSPWVLTSTNAMIVGGQLVTTQNATVSLFTTLNQLIQLTATIGLIIAAFTMKEKTNIGAFTAAGACAIIGVLVGFLIPFAIMFLGSAFGQMASRTGMTRPSQGPSAEEEYKSSYPAGPPTRGTIEPGEQGKREKGSSAERTKETSELRYCPYCGARIAADDLFCPTCGSSLEHKQTS